MQLIEQKTLWNQGYIIYFVTFISEVSVQLYDTHTGMRRGVTWYKTMETMKSRVSLPVSPLFEQYNKLT